MEFPVWNLDEKENTGNLAIEDLCLLPCDKYFLTIRPSDAIEVYMKIIYQNDYKIVIRSPHEFDHLEGENMVAMDDYKSEKRFFVNKELIEHFGIFKDNFIEDENRIEYEFSNIAKQKPASKKQLQLSDTNKYSFLAAACILNLEILAKEIFSFMYKDFNFEIVIMSFLITFHYEMKPLALSLYSLIREYVLYYNGIITDFLNPDVKLLLRTLNEYWIETDRESVKLVGKSNLIKFNSLIFKSCLNWKIKDRESFYFKPLMQYQLFQIQRKKTLDAYEFEEDSYPHKYYLKSDKNDKVVAFGFQAGNHDVIHIFKSEVSKIVPYSDEYIGCIERNYWGTVFEIFDYGLPEKSMAKIPEHLWSQRRNIGQIAYETNIMGEVPRYFKSKIHDFTEKKDATIISMKPEYNKEKDCFQLNFYGRAKKASARNFQMIFPNDENSILLMHGKVDKNKFNLDYRHPFNVLQAFSISLISISKKFLVS